jgi:hypothetical protein
VKTQDQQNKTNKNGKLSEHISNEEHSRKKMKRAAIFLLLVLVVVATIEAGPAQSLAEQRVVKGEYAILNQKSIRSIMTSHF